MVGKQPVKSVQVVPSIWLAKTAQQKIWLSSLVSCDGEKIGVVSCGDKLDSGIRRDSHIQWCRDLDGGGLGVRGLYASRHLFQWWILVGIFEQHRRWGLVMKIGCCWWSWSTWMVVGWKHIYGETGLILILMMSGTHCGLYDWQIWMVVWVKWFDRMLVWSRVRWLGGIFQLAWVPLCGRLYRHFWWRGRDSHCHKIF